LRANRPSEKIVIIVTALGAYVLGVIFAPGPTRAVLKALGSLTAALMVVLFIFWRIFPTSAGSLRRF
jgi:hypothetical protein